jgi:hypothetical protein
MYTNECILVKRQHDYNGIYYITHTSVIALFHLIASDLFIRCV